MLKWHRARRRASDTPFTASRIVEGLRAGASVEVDLLIHRDRGFVVLHDRNLAPGTTGRGQVHRASAHKLRALRLRSADGRAGNDPVLLLDDLAGLLDSMELPPTASLQLDFKEDARALDGRCIASFAAAVAPFASHAILSCGDAEAVRVLTDAVPGLAVGYDPCHRGAADALLASRDFAGFVEAACTASPRASMIYLEIRLILAADDDGVDLIGAFHDSGRRVDAYTFAGPANPGWRPVIDRLLELGVDQITVDDPDGVAALYGG
ncbi:hypothetical protein GOHSU_28_00290 [Gordonia hirsuta DSM 44140 = NBRC 16056]|uniref:GP-PDE domain-containing protein n=1 Tax=Gordonia hirsuta DSM 44140 = NBRC 16056 TaxID=1121927 RepID=L7LAR0_9ACTN|nr:glycerophosphodiester phosphodiesterase family protein [Gordonia hirsuta]GAC57974.1 hypothetical protein GOHSU_28_00290 [Gordonia hirsuta DSM 44140 = NBRC 16056]